MKLWSSTLGPIWDTSLSNLLVSVSGNNSVYDRNQIERLQPATVAGNNIKSVTTVVKEG